MSAYKFAADVLEEVLRLLGERPELVQVTRTVWIRADKVTAFDAALGGGSQQKGADGWNMRCA